MILASKLRSKIVERMSGVSAACQEDKRSAEPSPIKHFKLDTFSDGDELNLVR